MQGPLLLKFLINNCDVAAECVLSKFDDSTELGARYLCSHSEGCQHVREKDRQNSHVLKAMEVQILVPGKECQVSLHAGG